MYRDKTWWWLTLAAIVGVLAAASVHNFEPSTTAFHYEDRVEIHDGFYAGRLGRVSGCWSDLLGYRSYTVKLETGELVLGVAEEALQMHPDQESRPQRTWKW